MIFVFDWDGTLGGRTSILSHENEVAIKKLKKIGHTVIVATGRHPQEIIDKLKGNKDICKYVIGANGSLIINQETGEKNFIANITSDDFQDILKEIKTHSGSIIYIKALREDKVMRYKNPHHVFNPSEGTKKDFELPHLSIGIEFSNGKEFKKIVNYWKDKYKDRLSISASANNFMNFNHISTNKWEAIQWVVNQIGKSNEKIITLGDSLNDVGMVQKADLGIAMGNAESKLIEAADLIIGSCEESGILKFVVELEDDPNILNIKR